MQQVLADGKVATKLSHGSCLRGSMHPCWRSEEGRLLELATLDLPAALTAASTIAEKPCLVHLSSAIRGHCKRCALQQSCKAAMGRRPTPACVLFEFFDDYPVMKPWILDVSTKQSLKALVDLLGFDCSWEKRQNSSTRATMLGGEVDLSDVASAGVRIRNREGRASQVVSTTITPRTLFY